MLHKNASTWGDRVRIIGLSCDQELDLLKNHINAKQWTNVEHCLVGNGSCTAAEEFGVQGIPHVILVDTKGVIVFIGHPAARPNLEGDINKLLNGETI